MSSSSLKESTSLILVTLILLSLVLFGVLSVASANADYRLAVRSASRTAEFYRCEALAEDFYATAAEAYYSAERQASAALLSSRQPAPVAALAASTQGDAAKLRAKLTLYYFGEEMTARFTGAQFSNDLTALAGNDVVSTEVKCALPAVTAEKFSQQVSVTLKIAPNGQKPLEIVEWIQWQEAFEADFSMPVLIFG